MDSEDLGRVASETLIGVIKAALQLVLREKELLEGMRKSEATREILRMQLALMKAENAAKRGLTETAMGHLNKEIERWTEEDEAWEDVPKVIELRDAIECLVETLGPD